MPRNLAQLYSGPSRPGDDSDAIGPAPLEPITLADFLRRDFPPREMLLAPWLPVKGLALLFAPRGIGKTHFALGVAFAIATGGRFLKWHAPQPRRVLLLDGEMPAAALQAVSYTHLTLPTKRIV